MNKKLRVFEAFAGVGSQRMALRNLGIEYEVVGISEIDKYALKSYKAIHGDCPNYGDISKLSVDELPDMDLFTYSFPCQDLSIAGKQKGLGEGTRSGLLYECERIIESKKPKYLLLENVKNLVGRRFKPEFDKWLEYLEELGYTNYWQVLNAKEYGVPQNRERVFVVSILGSRKFEFPQKIKLTKRIKDILESEVDGKYYISKPFEIISKTEKSEIITLNIRQQVKVRKYEVDIIKLKAVLKESKLNAKLTNKDISNKLGVKITKVEHWFRTDKCFSIPDSEIWTKLKKTLNIKTSKFDKSILEFEIKDNKFDSSNRVYHENGISPTLMCSGESSAKKIITNNSMIRKLTPLECWRLMGFKDEDFYKAKNSGLSDSQLYKQAGNSIVVPVLEGIFRELFLK